MSAKRQHVYVATQWLIKGALIVYGIGAVLSLIRLAMLAFFKPAPWPQGTHLDVSAAALIMTILMVPVLVSLLAVVRSAHAGAPFTAENGRRLRRIGWLLIAACVVQPVLVAFADPSMAVQAFIAATGKGLIPVMLCFVVAHCFDVGRDMREDLEGTV